MNEAVYCRNIFPSGLPVDLAASRGLHPPLLTVKRSNHTSIDEYMVVVQRFRWSELWILAKNA